MADIPAPAQDATKRNLLDLIGIGIAGRDTQLSQIIHTHAASQFSGTHPLLFDTRTASASGIALAGGMTIDAMDGHDGYNPAKGHIGCGVFPAAFALMTDQG